VAEHSQGRELGGLPPQRMYLVTKKCVLHQGDVTVELTTDQHRRFLLWDADRQNGPYIQDILSDVSLDVREFLMSGCCGPCFDATFKDSEDEDEDFDDSDLDTGD
jgi:hypothetical protein